MNIIDTYYYLIAKEFHTDIIGVKETVCRYIEDLKERIDNSDDEKTKLFWYEEFSDNRIQTHMNSLHYCLYLVVIYLYL